MKKKNYSLLFIFITIFIDITGLGIIIPIIPSLISELIDGSISEAATYSGWLIIIRIWNKLYCTSCCTKYYVVVSWKNISRNYGSQPNNCIGIYS